MKYTKTEKTFLGDIYTPVSLYLKIRQKFHQALLLESSDYSSKEDSHSFICFDALESFILDEQSLHIVQGNSRVKKDMKAIDIPESMQEFLRGIQTDDSQRLDAVFGYSSYESVEHFENIKLNENKDDDAIAIMRYDFYRFVISFDHFYESIKIVEYIPEGEGSQIDDIFRLLRHEHTPEFGFELNGEERSNISDEVFKNYVDDAKSHLKRGDIFQIVLSRSFTTPYTGDDFQVYRSLRSINPSPYLYYFNYGSYKIFGSSPEAQIVIKNSKAEIHPIAGTLRRSGNYEDDMKKAEILRNDPKENAEHVMLVDLARNDLGRHGKNVEVSKYKEVQYFSHVVHLCSVVEAELKDKVNSFRVFADTFPAGTLSGAPKYKAMQLIDKYEKTKRGFYGGAIGILGLNGDVNHAILIRSFLAKNRQLRYQAGAGIVIDSNAESELQEVNNKLAALKKAIKLATQN